MQNEISARLDRAEAEIERLQGEVSGITNVIVSVLSDTLRNQPEIADRILLLTSKEIERLEVEASPRQAFRKEGAQRFYDRFARQIDSAMKGLN